MNLEGGLIEVLLGDCVLVGQTHSTTAAYGDPSAGAPAGGCGVRQWGQGAPDRARTAVGLSAFCREAPSAAEAITRSTVLHWKLIMQRRELATAAKLASWLTRARTAKRGAAYASEKQRGYLQARADQAGSGLAATGIAAADADVTALVGRSSVPPERVVLAANRLANAVGVPALVRLTAPDGEAQRIGQARVAAQPKARALLLCRAAQHPIRQG